MHLPKAILIVQPTMIRGCGRFTRGGRGPRLVVGRTTFQRFGRSLVPPVGGYMFSQIFPICGQPEVRKYCGGRVRFCPHRALLTFPGRVDCSLQSGSLGVGFFPRKKTLISKVASVVTFRTISR